MCINMASKFSSRKLLAALFLIDIFHLTAYTTAAPSMFLYVHICMYIYADRHSGKDVREYNLTEEEISWVYSRDDFSMGLEETEE